MTKKVFATTELISILTYALASINLLKFGSTGGTLDKESCGKTAHEIETNVLNRLNGLVAVLPQDPSDVLEDEALFDEIDAHEKQIEYLTWALNDYFNPEYVQADK